MPIITCVDCNKEMSDMAYSCPNCGRPTDARPVVASSPRKSDVPKSVGLLLGLGIFLFPYVFAWFTLRKGHATLARVVSFSWLAIALLIGFSAENKKEEAPPTRQVMKVKIDDILSDRMANEISAEKKYKDQLVDVTGRITEIKKDFVDGSVVELRAEDSWSFSTFEAHFDSKYDDQVLELRRGTYLRVVCQVTRVSRNIRADSCVMAK